MVARTIGNYQIAERVGAGGMGEVFRARDTHLDRDVAIKVLPAGSLADDSARRRSRQEALALSRLSHANIGTIFDFDTENGIDFLVMEYLHGPTLAQKLSSVVNLSFPRPVRIWRISCWRAVTRGKHSAS